MAQSSLFIVDVACYLLRNGQTVNFWNPCLAWVTKLINIENYLPKTRLVLTHVMTRITTVKNDNTTMTRKSPISIVSHVTPAPTKPKKPTNVKHTFNHIHVTVHLAALVSRWVCISFRLPLTNFTFQAVFVSPFLPNFPQLHCHVSILSPPPQPHTHYNPYLFTILTHTFHESISAFLGNGYRTAILSALYHRRRKWNRRRS